MMHVTPVSVNRGPNQAGVSPPNPPPTWDGGQCQSKNTTIAPLKPKLQEEKKTAVKTWPQTIWRRSFTIPNTQKHSVYYVKQASIASALPGQCMLFFVRMHFQQTYLRLAVMFTS